MTSCRIARSTARAKRPKVRAALQPWQQAVLHTWFEDLEPSDWYASSDSVDAMLRERFGELLEREGTQPVETFLDDTDGALAAIILFDQIPRNIHRGSAKAFAWDPLAQSLSREFAARGWLESASSKKCQFALMPLMHSEHLPDQELSLELFARFAPGSLDYARSHHEMIERFGRFPHRNDVLGREKTAAEQRAIDGGFSW